MSQKITQLPNESVLTSKFFFRFSLILLATFIIILLSSCEGPRGPVGPIGPEASGDGYTDIKTVEFTIRPQDWVQDPELNNRWVFKYNTDVLTNEIELNGFVLTYLKAGNKQTWSSLPYTFLSRSDNGAYYSTEYSLWWGVGQVEIQYTETHPIQPLKPDFNVNIKMVAARDVYKEALLPVKDNYVKVMNKIHAQNNFAEDELANTSK